MHSFSKHFFTKTLLTSIETYLKQCLKFKFTHSFICRHIPLMHNQIYKVLFFAHSTSPSRTCPNVFYGIFFYSLSKKHSFTRTLVTEYIFLFLHRMKTFFFFFKNSLLSAFAPYIFNKRDNYTGIGPTTILALFLNFLATTSLFFVHLKVFNVYPSAATHRTIAICLFSGLFLANTFWQWFPKWPILAPSLQHRRNYWALYSNRQ